MKRSVDFEALDNINYLHCRCKSNSYYSNKDRLEVVVH